MSVWLLFMYSLYTKGINPVSGINVLNISLSSLSFTFGYFFFFYVQTFKFVIKSNN